MFLDQQFYLQLQIFELQCVWASNVEDLDWTRRIGSFLSADIGVGTQEGWEYRPAQQCHFQSSQSFRRSRSLQIKMRLIDWGLQLITKKLIFKIVGNESKEKFTTPVALIALKDLPISMVWNFVSLSSLKTKI